MWGKQKRKRELPLAVMAVGLSFAGSLLIFTAKEHVEYKPVSAVAVVPRLPTVLGAETSPRGEQEVPAVEEPVMVKIPDTSEVTAKSFLVFDVPTGKTILEKNSDAQGSIASLTKLLTALVVYNEGDLSDWVTVISADHLKYSPVLNIANGDEVQVRDLFNAMLVGSENDAAVTLARYVSKKTGKDFVDLMNEQAAKLGMDSSSFSNPMGFDSWRNFSTAQDLKKLVVETQKYAAFTNLGKTKLYTFESKSERLYKAAATNKLIGVDSSIEAIKTGYTANTQGAMIVKVNHQGNQFIIILLGSDDREADTMSLKKAVVESFDWN